MAERDAAGVDRAGRSATRGGVSAATGRLRRRAEKSPDRALSAASEAFRRRAVLAVGLTALLLAAIAAVIAWRQYDEAKTRAVGDIQARAASLGAVVDTSFSGEIEILQTAARAPSVVGEDVGPMEAYLARIEAGPKRPFSSGLAWIDSKGVVRDSTTAAVKGGRPLNVSSRPYFQRVMATGAPYVSAGLIGLVTRRPLIVVAVPTTDARGRPSGVLAGSIALPSGALSSQALALGLGGLKIIDREGHLLLSRLAPVANRALLARMRRLHSGVISGTAGLSGSGDDVVAFSTSDVPGWIVVIDRPSSSIFAPAQHALLLELASVAGALAVVFAVVALVVRRARNESSRQSSRTRAWARLTRTLAAANTPKEVAAALLTSLVGTFPGAVAVVALDGASGVLVEASTRGRPGRPGLEGATLERIAEFGRERSRSALLEREPALGGAELGRRYRALHAVPVGEGGGGSLGTISIITPASELDLDDWSLLESFADLALSALKRARLFEREHELATRLQRSLLPDRLPSPEGVGLAGHYHAGGPAVVEVGGDWYDAVRRPDGIVQLCVGDVSGRGIGAAVVMGRQRNSFHAYAYECVSPAQIIRRMLRHVHGDQMITVACVSVDPYTGEVAYSCAGHPPPVLVDRRTNEVRLLDEASAPPIGVAEPGEIVEGRLQLDGPATLALYTDGLIERRGRSLDEAIDLLGEALAGADPATPDGVLEQLTAEIGPTVDDVALLIAALEDPAELEIELPALPAALPELRRRLRVWLQRQGFVDDALSEVVLAVSEACNNAIEHAYAGPEGTLRVRIAADGGLLRVLVEDEGRWRDARPGDERGRGILLMRNLMHSAQIETGPTGTQVRLERQRDGRGSDSELTPTGSAP